MSTENTMDQVHQLEHHYDPEGSKTGMWLFLFTELLLFGGLFLIYAVYRSMDAEAFHHAAGELNKALGSINTVVLLTSSLTMVLSINALRRGTIGRCLALLGSTLALSCAFLVIKFFEWRAKYHHEIFPGMEHLHSLPNGEAVFFNLYFMMTGLHGIHVVIGMIVMLVMAAKIRAGKITPERPDALEYTGLYWHLVDLIWVFLLPLFYLTN